MKKYCRYCTYSISTEDTFNFICENQQLVNLYNENNKTKNTGVDEKTAKEYFPKGCPLYKSKKENVKF